MEDVAPAPAPAAAAPSKTVILKVSDGEIKVQAAVVIKSKLIAEMLEDEDFESEPILPLPNVNKRTMAKVIEFLEYHHDPARPMPVVVKPIKSASMKENIKDFLWDAEFIDALESPAERNGEMVTKQACETLFAGVLAANYLDIESLLDLGCAKIASLLKNRTPKEIRQFFGIKEPTPEEEEEIRKNNQWIFDVRPADQPAAGGAAAGAPAAGAAPA